MGKNRRASLFLRSRSFLTPRPLLLPLLLFFFRDSFDSFRTALCSFVTLHASHLVPLCAFIFLLLFPPSAFSSLPDPIYPSSNYEQWHSLRNRVQLSPWVLCNTTDSN